MKHKLLVIMLLMSGLGFSQSLVSQEVTLTMSVGDQPGIQVFIPNVSEENLEDAIKDVFKPYKGKSKKIKSSDEFILDDASIEEISSNPVAIHQTIVKANKGYTYTAFFNLDGKFLSSSASPEKFSFANEIVKKIAQMATKYYASEIEKAEFRKLENEKKELEKEREKESKDLLDAKD